MLGHGAFNIEGVATRPPLHAGGAVMDPALREARVALD